MSKPGKFQDKSITCEVSGEKFAISAGEQAFYRENGLAMPKRCGA
jgi:hypothetical protein